VGGRDGLIVDYGGVLTTDVFASFRAFCESEGLPPDTVRDRFRTDPEARGLLAGLETGALDVTAFEPRFAALLAVEPTGLIGRLFGAIGPDATMLDGVRAARRAGARTALLSNSWVDDLPGNLKPARAIGMATVLHRGDAGATLAEVRRLLR